MNDDSSAERLASRVRAWARVQPAGTRLPTTRELAAEHGVGPVTVQRAISRLVSEALVETRPGAGSYVAARRAPAPADVAWQAAALGPARPDVDAEQGSGLRSVTADVIGMHSGYPSIDLLPAHLVLPALQRAARDPAVALSVSPSGGLPELRRHFAAALAAAAPGAPAVADLQVLVTSGGQSALTAALRGLARPGDAVVMESPTFWGAVAAARNAGLRVVPIATGPAGIDPGDLDDALSRHGARVVYAQPTFTNPTGGSWTPAVREQVHAVLAARKAFLIEDDWARDLALDADPPPPMAAADPDGHVVYVRSLTKSLSPAVRVAALIARGPAVHRLRTGRWVGDLYVSGVLQRAALDVLAHPGWPRHLRRLRVALAERRDSLRTALARHVPEVVLPEPPRGGLGLWLTLPPGRTAADTAARCLHAGLAVSPGDEWFPAEPDGEYLRLSYAASSPARHDEAAQLRHRALA